MAPLSFIHQILHSSIVPFPHSPIPQVLVFDPQSLINRLGKMDKMAEKGVTQPKKQADAFRTWLSARRHFGAGAGPGGVGMDPARRRTSAPAVVFEGAQRRRGGGEEGNARPENERAREVLGQAVASQNKIEQLQEEGQHFFPLHSVPVEHCRGFQAKHNYFHVYSGTSE